MACVWGEDHLHLGRKKFTTCTNNKSQAIQFLQWLHQSQLECFGPGMTNPLLSQGIPEPRNLKEKMGVRWKSQAFIEEVDIETVLGLSDHELIKLILELQNWIKVIFSIFKRQTKKLRNQVNNDYYTEKIKDLNIIKSFIWNCFPDKRGC